jgi:hypothetical protein
MRKLALLLAVMVGSFPLAHAAPAGAVPPTRTPFSFTADPLVLGDICSFPVTVVSNLRGTETDFTNESGALTMLLIYNVEQDTFSANGKTLTGEPYTFEIQVLFDENGDVTHVYASGTVETIRFPSGTLFISAGRVDFEAHPGSIFLIAPDVGVTGDVAAFCGFFADP